MNGTSGYTCRSTRGKKPCRKRETVHEKRPNWLKWAVSPAPDCGPKRIAKDVQHALYLFGHLREIVNLYLNYIIFSL